MEPITIISTITAALGAVEKGAQLAQRLAKAKSDRIADHGEQLIEMRAALLEARSALLDSRVALQEQDQEVARLREALENKAKVGRWGDAYFAVEEGKPTGSPYCLRSYEEDHKLRSLVKVYRVGVDYACTVCGSECAGGNFPVTQ